ncbi:Hypothetical protein FKW44_019362 [Caligus rogercresseyi]|uniref:Uncharacterized protein n=1 Tax=Caligus rogercresseyi TaxID=217165 RepID=A0A7T8GVR1_CALRO|nr:Hypothetical protein FKW44_019362 [Caligus rogercresseyi]
MPRRPRTADFRSLLVITFNDSESITIHDTPPLYKQHTENNNTTVPEVITISDSEEESPPDNKPPPKSKITHPSNCQQSPHIVTFRPVSPSETPTKTTTPGHKNYNASSSQP